MSLLGLNGLVEQPVRREYNPVNGWITYQRFHGPADAVQGAIPALVNAKLRFSEFEVEAGIRGIEIQYSNAQDGAAPATNPDDEQTVTWELRGNSLTKPLFDHPKFDTLAAADKVTLNRLLNGELNYSSPDVTALTDEAGEFRDHLEKGQDSFPVSQYVLRRTGVVAQGWAGTFGIENVGKVYDTTDLLKSHEDVPADLNFALPDGKWLKQTPTILRERDGRLRMNLEWWHTDRASTLIYDFVTT